MVVIANVVLNGPFKLNFECVTHTLGYPLGREIDAIVYHIREKRLEVETSNQLTRATSLGKLVRLETIDQQLQRYFMWFRRSTDRNPSRLKKRFMLCVWWCRDGIVITSCSLPAILWSTRQLPWWNSRVLFGKITRICNCFFFSITLHPAWETSQNILFILLTPVSCHIQSSPKAIHFKLSSLSFTFAYSTWKNFRRRF